MFHEFASAMGAEALLANMTEFGKSPALNPDTLQKLGYRMVIWPVSSLRVANFSQGLFYAELEKEGTTAGLINRMQTRAELYDLINLKGYEALDASILASRLP